MVLPSGASENHGHFPSKGGPLRFVLIFMLTELSRLQERQAPLYCLIGIQYKSGHTSQGCICLSMPWEGHSANKMFLVRKPNSWCVLFPFVLSCIPCFCSTFLFLFYDIFNDPEVQIGKYSWNYTCLKCSQATELWASHRNPPAILGQCGVQCTHSFPRCSCPSPYSLAF